MTESNSNRTIDSLQSIKIHSLQKRLIGMIILIAVSITALVAATTAGTIAIANSITNDRNLNAVKHEMVEEMRRLKEYTEMNDVTIEDLNNQISMIVSRVKYHSKIFSDFISFSVESSRTLCSNSIRERYFGNFWIVFENRSVRGCGPYIR